jgi:hypothetical protein
MVQARSRAIRIEIPTTQVSINETIANICQFSSLSGFFIDVVYWVVIDIERASVDLIYLASIVQPPLPSASPFHFPIQHPEDISKMSRTIRWLVFHQRSVFFSSQSHSFSYSHRYNRCQTFFTPSQ